MKYYRTEIVIALLISFVIIGAVVFFLSDMNTKRKEKPIELFELILPEADLVLSVNKPAQFLNMLECQPVLKSYFKTLIPEPYFSLLSNMKRFPVLFAYYPRGIVMCYQSAHQGNEAASFFWKEYAVSMKQNGIDFSFYPKEGGRYLGSYFFKGIGVISYSRLLLETIADNHRVQQIVCPPELVLLKKNLDKEALLNALFCPDSVVGWQAIDLFLHEEQVCCLYNQPLPEIADSMLTVTSDSLALEIEKIIPGIQIQPGFSRDETGVYYTFCADLVQTSSPEKENNVEKVPESF